MNALHAVAAASTAWLLSVGHASAIECRGSYQLVNGAEISTPYCRDTYLAKVAGVSAQKVRQNPNFKEEVCRRVGHDNRVREACNNQDNDTSGK